MNFRNKYRYLSIKRYVNHKKSTDGKGKGIGDCKNCMASILLSLLCLCFSLDVAAQTRRALLVGISDYESAGDLNVWTNIHGTNDVQLMAECLSRQGFSDRMVLLDEKATHARILDEFKKLTLRVQPGDTVFFHFSGHGQPFEDLDGDEGDADGWDESIVPYDAFPHFEKGEYEGQHHLTDDCLYDLLLDIRKKAGRKGMVYAVIDACFSGSVMRGDDENTYKYNIVAFCVSKRREFSPVASRKVFRLLETSDDCADLIALEASLPFRKTREIKENNQFYGPLSFNVVMSLQKHPLSEGLKWIDELQRRYRNDRRLNREVIFCESSIPFEF